MYSPNPPPFGNDVGSLKQYVGDEFQRIAQSGSDRIDSYIFNALAVAPDRPRAGMVAYANGTNWNPGNGAGLYLFTTAWKKVGPPLTGRAVLVGGTVTVAYTGTTAASNILVTCQIPGGTPGFLRISARVVGTSFTILSSSGTDTSTVAYMVIEP
jgi:hypothetical protein